jgi:C-terminal processing protease CtpA/Prc
VDLCDIMADFVYIAPAVPKPRLCVLRKVPTYAGYGFNLHAKQGHNGQFIGKVDPSSPAETGGLRDGDRLIEVNGTNVENESHAQVVALVKDRPGEVTMLVVDSQTDAYYRERHIAITTDLLRDDLPAPAPRASDERIATERIVDEVKDRVTGKWRSMSDSFPIIF